MSNKGMSKVECENLLSENSITEYDLVKAYLTKKYVTRLKTAIIAVTIILVVAIAQITKGGNLSIIGMLIAVTADKIAKEKSINAVEIEPSPT